MDAKPQSTGREKNKAGCTREMLISAAVHCLCPSIRKERRTTTKRRDLPELTIQATGARVTPHHDHVGHEVPLVGGRRVPLRRLVSVHSVEAPAGVDV